MATLYMGSRIGVCLTEALEEMIEDRTLSAKLAYQVLLQFDRVGRLRTLFVSDQLFAYIVSLLFVYVRISLLPCSNYGFVYVLY